MQQEALINVVCTDRIDDKTTKADLSDWTDGIITFLHYVKSGGLNFTKELKKHKVLMSFFSDQFRKVVLSLLWAFKTAMKF